MFAVASRESNYEMNIKCEIQRVKKRIKQLHQVTGCKTSY